MPAPTVEDHELSVRTSLLGVAVAFAVFVAMQVAVILSTVVWPWGPLALGVLGVGGGFLAFFRSGTHLRRAAAFGLVLGTLFALGLVLFGLPLGRNAT